VGGIGEVGGAGEGAPWSSLALLLGEAEKLSGWAEGTVSSEESEDADDVVEEVGEEDEVDEEEGEEDVVSPVRRRGARACTIHGYWSTVHSNTLINREGDPPV